MFPGSNDIFRTQADTRFNSFAEPLNSVNTNPGNWGVNPNYLTPPYLSPFRPQYQGPSGPSYAQFRPGFGTSVNQVINPFAPGGDNYGGNYMQQQSPYYDSMSNAPRDSTASFMQNWVLPAAVSFGAFKYLTRGSTAIGRSVGGGLAGGLFSGAGLARMAPNAIRAGRWAGGLAGGLALPLLGAQLAMDGIDKAVFDPYIAQRQMANDLRENFRGVTFGDANGNAINGGGISREAAANIAKRVSRAGAMDMTFNQMETSMLTDYASRSGLMDNMNPDQMSQRFESILKQVKVVMSIANTSDFKETIEIMSKMQMAGASSAQLNGLMGRLGATAAAGGQSFQKLFNTIGAQGQYLFGAQGLTPYVGQEAAFRSSAAMSSAFRSGLISPALMARMGGQEGATQSGTAALVSAYQTPYSAIQGFNAYMNGGETGNVVSNIGRLGGHLAGNTLQNVGRFMASQTAVTSRQIQDRGMFGVMEQVYQIAKMLPNGLNKEGKVDAGVAYMIMTQQMGLTPDMAQAALAQLHTYNDPKSVNQMMAGNQRSSIDSLLKYNQQEGLNRGIFTTPYNAVKRGLMHVQDAGANLVGNVNEVFGGVGDSLEKFFMSAFMGVNEKDQSLRTLEFDQLGKTTYQALNIDYENTSFANSSAIRKINEAAKGGNKDAMKFVGSTGAERANALRELARQGVVDKEFAKGSEAKPLLSYADTLKTEDVRLDGNDLKTIDNTLGKGMTFLKDKSFRDNTEYAALMYKLGQNLDNGGKIDDATKKRIAELRGVDASKISDYDIDEYLDEYTKQAGKNRNFHIGAAGLVADSAEELAKQMQAKNMALQSVEVKSAGDLKATRAQMQTQMAHMQERQRMRQLHKEGKIDTNTYYQAINGIDNGQTVGKFADAVDKFAEVIGGMKGDKKPLQGSAYIQNQMVPPRGVDPKAGLAKTD